MNERESVKEPRVSREARETNRRESGEILVRIWCETVCRVKQRESAANLCELGVESVIRYGCG
eukprot:7151399-Prymnesium_polylepis.2